uniref:Reverse transcriptase domain-containing protein n=1 Tax=Tanacetum cinerariifolium TaxID=118510 RepID=A0A6L2MJX9_TANCI|nr:hypothetical protein [Tanacetum cinerariifolium]
MPTASAARRRKGVVIRDPKEIATPSVLVHSEPKSKDKGKGILVEEPKPLKKQAQIEQDEAYVRELAAGLNANINWNEVIEQEKAAKKQKLDEEVEELKTYLQIVPNDEDDVYTKATPLALKLRAASPSPIPPPRIRRARISVRPQTQLSAATEALIAVVVIPLPPLPLPSPPLLLPATNHREDVLEADRQIQQGHDKTREPDPARDPTPHDRLADAGSSCVLYFLVILKKMPPQRTAATTTPMTDAQIKELIAQEVATVLAEYEATQCRLPGLIQGSVMASKPKTMQDAIEFATNLMDQKICTFADRQAKNKRELDDNSKNN